MRLLATVLLTTFVTLSANAATVHLTDGQSVYGCIVWRGHAGVTVLIDCNPHPYFARDHEVFIEADRICRIDEETCVSKTKLKDTPLKGQWAAEARKADAANRKADGARLASKKKTEGKTVAEGGVQRNGSPVTSVNE